jgi:hypothetical protein
MMRRDAPRRPSAKAQLCELVDAPQAASTSAVST